MILVVDPGTTTGFVVRGARSIVMEGQLPGMDLVDWVFEHYHYENHREKKLDGIVCERMELTARTLKVDQAGVHDGLDVIGALRWLAQWNEWGWHWQTPAQKNRVSDDRLKELGYYTPGRPHQNDAARHLTLFEAKTGLR